MTKPATKTSTSDVLARIASLKGEAKPNRTFTPQLFTFRDGRIGASVKITGSTRAAGTVNIEHAEEIIKDPDGFREALLDALDMLEDEDARADALEARAKREERAAARKEEKRPRRSSRRTRDEDEDDARDQERPGQTTSSNRDAAGDAAGAHTTTRRTRQDSGPRRVLLCFDHQPACADEIQTP